MQAPLSALNKPALVYEFLGTAFMVYAFHLNSDSLRGYAYFVWWLVAYPVSGAEFNPAVSLACFVVKSEKNREAQAKQMGLVMLVQLLGAFSGLLMMFILMKYNGRTLLKPTDPKMYFDISGDVYWARPIFQEILLTFLFTLIYLVLRFEKQMKRVDRIVKGLAACLTLIVCLSMSAKSGGCLNPAIGVVSSIFMIGYEN
jgi:glycerol uptake facilitator-like aquaporin